MKAIQSLVELFFKEHKRPVWHSQLLSNWKLIVGDLQKQMYLAKIELNTIFVGVYNQAWLQELFMLSGQIIKIINKKLGNDYVHSVRFFLHVYRPHLIVEKKAVAVSSIDVCRPLLGERECKALQAVHDGSIRECLVKLFYQCRP